MTIKTKNKLLIVFTIVIFSCLLYLPQMKDLGLYRDAWNYFYNLTVRGTDAIIQAFNADRPADGYLFSILYQLFGTNVNAYLIWCLCCRILSSVLFALIMLVIWPNSPAAAGLAGLFAAAFPGFLQQVDGITYVPHQTAMLCFMLSLGLTVFAVRTRRKSLRFVYICLALLLSFCNVMLQEYYVGMEIYRLVFIIVLLWQDQKCESWRKLIRNGIWKYMVYFLPVIGFVIWRTFIFSAKRAGTNVMKEVVLPFLTHPVHELGELGVRIMKNIWKLFVGSWTLPAYNLINGLPMKTFVRSLIPVFLIFVAGCAGLYLLNRRRTALKDGGTEENHSLWILIGFISGAAAILPLIITRREINFTASYDRFSWPGMIGAILLLVALIRLLPNQLVSNVLLLAVLCQSVFVQWRNQEVYVDIAAKTKDFWQQLIWRAPSLDIKTTLVTAGLPLAEEDYEIFAPASMIYYPDVKDWSPIASEVLNANTVRDVRMGKLIYRIVREIYIEKDYSRLLAISKPGGNSCLHVLDNKNLIYPSGETSLLQEIGMYSLADQILLDPETPGVYPFFLGSEQEHGWCYYYEKMELALQRGEPETAAKLADEALAQGLMAGDNSELIPIIEAYIQTGRVNEALPFAEKIKSDEYMTYMAVNYFNAKEDMTPYSTVMDILSEN